MFLLAHGINPKTVGFKHDLTRQKYHHLYTIFASNRVKEYGYDQSEAGRNEQILAFLMAYKRGIRGPIMRTFARRFLTYARKHEKKLRQIYFGIHSTKTIPQDLKPRVMRIFRAELGRLT